MFRAVTATPSEWSKTCREKLSPRDIWNNREEAWLAGTVLLQLLPATVVDVDNRRSIERLRNSGLANDLYLQNTGGNGALMGKLHRHLFHLLLASEIGNNFKLNTE